MILKCFDGPMDGAVYVLLSRDTKEESNRSTNRKPDGLWFDCKDVYGRNVQQQYAYEKLESLGNGIVMCYRYTGDVVDTGIEMDVAPKEST